MTTPSPAQPETAPVCALAADGDCAGEIARRWPVDGRPVALCEGHAEDVEDLTNGVLAVVRDITATGVAGRKHVSSVA